MLITLLFEQPLLFLPIILALLISLTIHEVSHGLVALWQGDTTAKDLGRLSFNPIAHIDPLGAILLLTIGFGWGKPVPVNYLNLRDHKWGSAMVAIAGPLSNLIMIIFFGFLFKILAPGLNPLVLETVIGGSGNLLHIFLAMLILYNILLMVFNLVPIPPLDGSKVLFAVLPDKYSQFKYLLETRGPMILLFLVILDNFMNVGIFSSLFNVTLNFFARFF